jgi:hypothetical protein
MYMMIQPVGSARRVDAGLERKAVSGYQRLSNAKRELGSLLPRQLMRESNLELPSHRSVSPLLGGLDGRPELYNVGCPGRGALGCKAEALDHPATAAVVVLLPGEEIGEQ